MSNDLISRKALLNRFKYSETDNETDKAWICTVRRIIKEQTTAFDKEKVINEIRSGVMAANDEYIETCDEYYHGMQEAHKNDWKIVEKGGIE